jgi:hypothetical protein
MCLPRLALAVAQEQAKKQAYALCATTTINGGWEVAMCVAGKGGQTMTIVVVVVDVLLFCQSMSQSPSHHQHHTNTLAALLQHLLSMSTSCNNNQHLEDHEQ